MPVRGRGKEISTFRRCQGSREGCERRRPGGKRRLKKADTANEVGTAEKQTRKETRRSRDGGSASPRVSLASRGREMRGTYAAACNRRPRKPTAFIPAHADAPRMRCFNSQRRRARYHARAYARLVCCSLGASFGLSEPSEGSLFEILQAESLPRELTQTATATPLDANAAICTYRG